MKFNTTLLHMNIGNDEKTGATISPIYQTSAFEYESAEELESVFNNKAAGFAYTRISNPTISSFEKKISMIEGGVGALACSSGMAAISLALLNILRYDDEIVASSGLFGGTIGLFKDLESYGIKTKYVTEDSAEKFEEAISDKTKVVFIETIGNPKLDVIDIQAIAQIAHSHKIPLIVDNTVATPYIVRPFELGADIIVHSSSKYINGSGNSISGVIIDSGKFRWDFSKHTGLLEYKKYGEFAYLSKLRGGLFRNIGSCLSPFNAYLNSIGLETLGVRMERLCNNAFELAKYLKTNTKVMCVNYPGLEDSRYYNVAQKQFKNGYGALLTIRLGSKENAFKVINSLKYAKNVANIGDSKTLVIHPESTIYANSTNEEKINAGVYDDLIRISVGLEDIEDLIEDFKNAISKI